MAEETMKDFEKEINESFAQKKKLEDADAGKWDKFQQMLEAKEKVTVKIEEAVKGGVVAFLDEVRGFIPASHLSTQHVENLEEYKGKDLEVIVITVDPEKKRLVMSHRELEKSSRRNDRAAKLAAINVGDTVNGVVESIKDYGAFIDLGDGISGLVHISQLAYTRVKSVGAVLKEGQEVAAKVIAKEKGKISLSVKALQEAPEGYEEEAPRGERAPREPKEDYSKYEEKESATTSLGDLLKGIKL